MKFAEGIKAIIDERSQGSCEICGIATPDGHYHHRRPRGMGGSKRSETGAPVNALYLCRECHAWVESLRDHALRNGWLVRQSHDPALTPVNYRGTFSTLTNEGMVNSVMPESIR
jgi:5-methylcytosine-specific restriction protein A